MHQRGIHYIGRSSSVVLMFICSVLVSTLLSDCVPPGYSAYLPAATSEAKSYLRKPSGTSRKLALLTLHMQGELTEMLTGVRLSRMNTYYVSCLPASLLFIEEQNTSGSRDGWS